MPNPAPNGQRYTCHVTLPNGTVQAPAPVIAADRRSAARLVLARYPRGSRACCRPDHDLSESARVAELLAQRASSFPLVAANDEPRAPFGGDAA